MTLLSMRSTGISGLNLTQEEDYAKIMGQVQEIFEGRGEEPSLTAAQRYSAGISLCDKLIYNMTEEQLKVFYDKLGLDCLYGYIFIS